MLPAFPGEKSNRPVNQTMTDQLKTLIQQIQTTAQSDFYRGTVVFCGEWDWCHACAREAAQLFAPSQCLWISKQADDSAQTFAASRAQRYLGMEFEALIFDVYSGFDPDLFAALSGTIKGGGLLILLSPPLDDWESFNDPEKSRLAVWPYTAEDISGRFLRLTAQAFKNDANVVIVDQHRALPPEVAATSRVKPENPTQQSFFPCRTEDQQRAVQAIMHVVSGHRHRPLVITSDRGRGKSAALGIAAAQLLKQGVNNIIVTASRLEAISPVFDCAQNLLPGAHRVKGKLQFGGTGITYVAADELVRRHYECHLLMVDEAAAISAPQLEYYLKHYARIVFATTVHGYEGTGRGFALRFRDSLNQYTPGWQALRLDAPIRWAKHDPLEALVFKALMLDAEPAADDVAVSADVRNCVFEKLDRETLINDTNSLSQLFALLVLAHYQTQPADLRYLLDARNVHVCVLRCNNNIVAAALLEEEGAFDAELAAKIYANHRRVRGHLLAQSLATYGGMPSAPLLKYVRVMRIAVHPLAQRRGLGDLLLKNIEASLGRGKFDLWGASFGAAPELVCFWKKAGFSPVHLGLSRHAASGMPSALMLKALSDSGHELLDEARQKFSRRFPYMLADIYKDLEPTLVKTLIESEDGEASQSVSAEDRQDIESFVNLARGYEVNSVPVWKLVCAGLQNAKCAGRLTQLEYALLVAKVMQKKTWPDVVSALAFKGRKHALDCLREAVKKLYIRCV